MRLVKKAFSLVASSLAVLILSGFLSLRPIGGEISFAHHDTNHACNDISGSTKPVLSPDRPGREAGVEDSGRLNFDANPPAIDYQACGETASSSAGGALADGLVVGGVTGNLIRGWVWDTNLGYVSLNCEGGTNLGGRCGDQNYQTIIASDGQVHGWAWGDNIGWMSMRCKNDKNLEQDCGDPKDAVKTNYDGVKVAQDAEVGSTRENCAIARRGDFYGYAWTETVGWVDFCGAHVELTAPLRPVVTIETSNTPDGGPGGPGEPGGPGGCADLLCGPIDGGGPGGGADISEGTVYANGTDFYKIVVQVSDGSTPLNQADLNAHGVRAELVFDNKLRTDQVTRCSPADGDGLTACTYNGAILPTETLTPDSHWDAEEQGLVAYVRAIAPTNYPGDNIDMNDTDLLSLSTFQIFIDDIRYDQASRSFTFRPAIEVTQVVSVDSPPQPPAIDSVFAQREISTEHQIGAAFHPSLPGGPLSNLDIVKSAVQIFTQLHDCSDAFDFLFNEAWNGAAITNEDGSAELDVINYPGGGDANIDRPNNICSTGYFVTAATLRDIDRQFDEDLANGVEGTFLNEFLASGGLMGTTSRFIFSRVQDPALATNIRTDRAFGIQTRVEYPVTIGTEAPRPVKYFSRRVTDGSLLNQAADIRGNVRILQDTTGLPAGRGERRTIGERFVSARELFVRAISKRAKGQATAIEEKIFNNMAGTNLANPEYFFKRDIANLAFDEPCRIIFDDAANVTFTGNVTVQSTGCDVYFFQNIRPSAGKKLGIIALEDLTMTGERKGGSVYICGKVTDLENIHIAADRSVFPLGELDGAGGISCGTPDERVVQEGLRAGLPQFNLGNPVREVLKNQLTIVGSVRSNNCDGCAFKSPPESGDGSKITNSALMDTARFYDWNFMRYSKVNVAGDCWADDVGKSALLGDTACANNNPVSRGSVNVIFQEPTGLPIFKDAAARR